MKIKHEKSCGNVFADLGVANPVEVLAKAEIARKIANIIEHRKLKQTEAALVLGIDQPKVSKLVRGQLQDFALERLMGFIMKLDRDIEIVITKRPKGRSQSKIAVSTS